MKVFIKNLRAGDIYKADNIKYVILETRKERNNKIFVKWNEILDTNDIKAVEYYSYRDTDYWYMDQKIDSEIDILGYI